jgi:hypothetical protein
MVPGTKLTKMRMGDLAGWRDGKYKIILDIKTNIMENHFNFIKEEINNNNF